MSNTTDASAAERAAITFDLSELSAANHRRHFRLRVVTVALGLWILAGVAYLDFWIATVVGPAIIPLVEILDFANTTILGFTCAFATSWPIRALARPPVQAVLGSSGLTVMSFRGHTTRVQWGGGYESMTLLIRQISAKVPPMAAVRLVVTIHTREIVIPWARMIPWIYLPEDFPAAFLDMATKGGAHVEREDLPLLGVDAGGGRRTIYRLKPN